MKYYTDYGVGNDLLFFHVHFNSRSVRVSDAPLRDTRLSRA